MSMNVVSRDDVNHRKCYVLAPLIIPRIAMDVANVIIATARRDSATSDELFMRSGNRC